MKKEFHVDLILRNLPNVRQNLSCNGNSVFQRFGFHYKFRGGERSVLLAVSQQLQCIIFSPQSF